MTDSRTAAADHLLLACGSLAAGERVVVVCDERTADIGALFAARAEILGAEVRLFTLPVAAMHGTEPTTEAAAAMAESQLAIGLTTMSMAHTAARLEACRRGGRYLSLPEYSWELLADPSIHADFRGRAPLVRRFADRFSAGTSIHLTSRAGTDIRIAIGGRTGNYCPGFVEGPGTLGSPPDIEANVSPIETGSDGVVVVDGSIPCAEIGLLRSPVVLEVSGGRIVRFDGRDRGVVATLEKLFARVGSDKAYVLAECGVGLNDAARLTGVMLTDEGAAGCVHLGFGSNATVGGLNDVPFHLDFVIREPTLAIDGAVLIDNGAVKA